MLISVVIPFYSELSLIGGAVASVFSQRGLAADVKFEICIGNDGAIANQQVLDAVDAQYHPHIHIENNRFGKGPGGARNTGLALSSGEFIAFLDADDVWLPEKIAIQLRALATGKSFVSGAYRFQNGKTIVVPPRALRRASDVFWRQGIGTSTVIVSKALLGDTQFHNFRFSQDIDFWYRLALKSGFVYEGGAEPVTIYYTGGSTKNKLVQAQSLWHVMRQNHLSMSLCIPVLFRYAARGIFNHYLSGRKRS